MLMEPLQNITVISPESAVFTCKIAPGEPRAELTWFKGAMELSSNGKYVAKYEGDVATLEVTNTVPGDATEYRVEAVNKLGQITTQGTLTVHSMYYPGVKITLIIHIVYCKGQNSL